MKNVILICLISLAAIFSVSLISQNNTVNMKKQQDYPRSLASFDDFKKLTLEVEPYRAKRLISLDDFLKKGKEKNVVILDSRSEFRYKRKHLKGAIHIGFSDFTQESLRELIPDANTKILIYCNNNFEGDQIDFTSKMSLPQVNVESQILSERKPVMLALNIPTFINLYGYGYKNVYELDELVNVNDPRIKFEGKEVR